MATQQQDAARQLDRLAVCEIILRERRARDEGSFCDMVSYYHPDFEIETFWFKGGAGAFVAQNEDELSTYRPSYANLCYQMVRAGLKPQHDLPGQDLPETVDALKIEDRNMTNVRRRLL